MILTFREEWFDDRLKFDDQNGKFNHSLTVRSLTTDDDAKVVYSLIDLAAWGRAVQYVKGGTEGARERVRDGFHSMAV